VLNQVGRAQAIYREVRAMLESKELDIPVELLHSRFFAPDRQKKQESILERFGEKGKGPGILIATQVIEAGLNLTCDHLHTEICPMNALVQRAGRCARFSGEKGTVHVHETDGSALPYGEQELTEAWSRLPEQGTELSPQKVLEWVESCHAGADRRKAGQGWRDRRKECEELIRKRVQKAAFGGVSHLIRRGGDEVRVIVHDHPNGRMPNGFEGVSMYRDRIKNLLSKHGDIGWAFSPEGVWEEIGNRSQIDQVYAVCLKRAVACYTDTVGLELGVAGEQTSPGRDPPPRPGYAPLKPLQMESWSAHTKNVMVEIQKRVEQEAFRDGLLERGLGEGQLRELVRLTGFLHDVGKLQERWQKWAESAQRSVDAGYRHVALLAHTDFDAGSGEDREKARLIRPCRPAHAMASAFYGSLLLGLLTPSLAPLRRAACLAAVLAHHGGWAQSEIFGLDARSVEAMRELEPAIPEVCGEAPRKSAQERFAMQELDYPMSRFQEWWPLASYLIRTLRLSDQRATEEANTNA
jgi:CRISPR-associated endonuclease/helicase Cas3